MCCITQASSDDGACLKGSERSRNHSYLPVSPFLEPISPSHLHGCLGWVRAQKPSVEPSLLPRRERIDRTNPVV